MDILRNQIDADSILTSLYTKSAYTSIFLSLLRNPTPDLLSKLVITHLNKMISDLKYLIKMKYSKLTPDMQSNITKIALLLLGYGINVDTIIINLLRVGYTRFPLEHKYFKEFKGALPFIKFHGTRDSSVMDINLVTTLVTYDIESDIIFISTVQRNVKFYVTSFISKYKSKISDIILFIQGKNISGRNIEYLMYNLNIIGKMSQVKGDVSWMIKDMPKEDTVVIKQESLIRNEVVKSEVVKTDIKKTDLKKSDNSKVDMDIPTNIYNSFLHIIADLSFPKYYSLIQDMKTNKVPILDPKMYNGVVFASFEFDNYVQVYLWKILVYQKILFDIEIEIDESDLKTEESLEGYDIYLNIH